MRDQLARPFFANLSERQHEIKQEELMQMRRILETMCVVYMSACITACSFPTWLVGNDEGQAYEAYTEAMEKAGVPPERW